MKIYCHVCKKEIESLAVSLHRDEVTFGEMMKLGIGTPPPMESRHWWWRWWRRKKDPGDQTTGELILASTRWRAGGGRGGGGSLECLKWQLTAAGRRAVLGLTAETGLADGVRGRIWLVKWRGKERYYQTSKTNLEQTVIPPIPVLLQWQSLLGSATRILCKCGFM